MHCMNQLQVVPQAGDHKSFLRMFGIEETISPEVANLKTNSFSRYHNSFDRNQV